MKEREALKLALEALEYKPIGATSSEKDLNDQAITAIKEALREHAMYEVQRLGQEIQPEQEPVAWRYGALLYWDKLDALEFMRTSNDGYQLEPLYTTPPQRTWVGLTDDRVEELIDSLFHFDGTRWSTDTPRAVIQEIIKECE